MKKLDPLSTKTIDYVRNFFDLFELDYWSTPEWPDETTIQLRLGLVKEELAEVIDAVEKRDMVHLLKEITDLQYVLDGLYLTFGLERLKILAMREVHKSNLSKLGPNQTVSRNKLGKILKGKAYREPDLKWLVAEDRR